MAKENWMQKVNEDIKRRGTAGVFTAKAKRHGKSVHDYAKEVVRKYKGKPDLSPKQKTLLKEAVLALTYERIAKDRKGKYGHGGTTQGYRDRQDESLGMRSGRESSKTQDMRARREDSYGKWGKRDAENRGTSMAHGGKTQGYDDRQDESLSMRTGREGSKKQNYKARREDSYGKWGKRGTEGRHITMKKGGKTQGYNDQLDESLGMRTGTGKTQSYKDRRDESKGANKHLGRRAYSSVQAMDKGDRMMKRGGEIHGEVSVKDLDSTRVKDLMKKYNVKIKSREDIERAGEGFGQSTDIDYVVLRGPDKKGLLKVGLELDLVGKDGTAYSDYAKGGYVIEFVDRDDNVLGKKKLKHIEEDGNPDPDDYMDKATELNAYRGIVYDHKGNEISDLQIKDDENYAKGGTLSEKAVKKNYIRRDRYDKLKKEKDAKIDELKDANKDKVADLKKDLKDKGADCYEDIKTMKKDIGKTVAKRIDQVEKQKDKQCDTLTERINDECEADIYKGDDRAKKEKTESLILGGIGGLLLGIFFIK